MLLAANIDRIYLLFLVKFKCQSRYELGRKIFADKNCAILNRDGQTCQIKKNKPQNIFENQSFRGNYDVLKFNLRLPRRFSFVVALPRIIEGKDGERARIQ